MEQDQKYEFTFTVFTPTYNRARTLHRVYESLKNQTYRDFEWLIVDDGSADHTCELVSAWQAEADFPIRYIRQENCGKHLAFNRGAREAKGELFLTLDSDDACVPEALERFKHHWDAIPPVIKPQFSSVTALCTDQYGNLIGGKFPYDVTDSTYMEIHYKFKVRGEKWGFHRTEAIKKFLFPSVEGARFIPEGIVWSAIADQYKTRFVNEPLRIYWIEKSSQSDRLTGSGAPSKNAAGLALWHQFVLNRRTGWFCHAPLQVLGSAARYSRFSFHTGKSLLEQVGSLNNCLARIFWMVTLPAGYLLYLRDGKHPRKT
ncbi:MAG TPA: glycosyltransferase family A protein [Bacillota bacterium]|nr:glycosyltransferase family A protein [Bacillota bacterium]